MALCVLLVALGVADARGEGIAHLAVDGFGKTVVHEYPRSQMLLHGTLFDGNGIPAPGVGVQVVAQPFAGGSPGVYGGTTDSNGHYAVYVPRGSSRLVTLSAAGATREVRELVSPYLWITVDPRGHGRVLFTGGVAVARPFPLPTVMLQDLTPTGWQTFGAVNPNGNSHLWRYVYRHAPRGAIGLTLRFRATTLPNTAWQPGVSITKEATVR